MRIRGLGRVKTEILKLRGQLAPGPIVLLYHRVTHLQHDHHLLSVTPEHFEDQLQVLKQQYKVISLSELVKGLALGKNLGAEIVITFDDGYADNAETAMPLLAKYDMPATFYLATGFVGAKREQLQDDLERLILFPQLNPDQLRLVVGGNQFIWPMHSEESVKRNNALSAGRNMECKTETMLRHQANQEIHSLMRPLLPSEREGVFDQLRSQCGDPGPARVTHRAMSWDQARHMAACELFELGAHTVHHPYLSTLSLKEQCVEILESKLTLEEKIGKPITTFAYPYGTRLSYTAETVGLLKELGFTNTCSNFRERIGRMTDPFQIPRFVVRDWNGDEFLRQIRKGRL